MANYDKSRSPDTRVTFLDATFIDNLDQSQIARASFSFNVNGHILPPYPSATGHIRMTSGVPTTFNEGPAIEIQRGDRTQIDVIFKALVRYPRPIVRRGEYEEGNYPDYRRVTRIRIPISNSHGNTDSNFEGIHSLSTLEPFLVTTRSDRTTHEISLTIRYRIDTINNP
jgi:hypothetical protein